MRKANPGSPDNIYLGHARTKDQLREMERIAKRGICFMCPENIDEFYKQKDGLLDEGKHSYLVVNGYPYENTEHHLMSIPKDHVTSLEGLSDQFWLETLGYFKKMEKKLKVTGGALGMRFGDPAETGATAHHVHIHFIVPSKKIGPQDKPVRFKMSKSF